MLPNPSLRIQKRRLSSRPKARAALASRTTLTLVLPDVSAILRTALVAAIHTSLSAPPPGTFPLAASQLYTAHVLPARPAHAVHTSSPIDIKHSAHKNLSAFLKAAEKDGLVSLKHAKGDVLVAAVHPAAAEHRPYRTVAQDVARERKRAEREKEDEDARAAGARELPVTELWKPHQSSLRLFEALDREFVPPVHVYA
jgi:translation initiation factor 2D